MFSIQGLTENTLFTGEPSCGAWNNFISIKLLQGVYEEPSEGKGTLPCRLLTLRMEENKKNTPKLAPPFHFTQFIVTGSWTEITALYVGQTDCPEFLQGFTNSQTPSTMEHPSLARWLLAAGQGGDSIRTRTRLLLKPER